jgi:hypothetical protein
MHDFVAAIAVTCLIVPQAMSYAILTGVPPINGYGIMGFDRQRSITLKSFDCRAFTPARRRKLGPAVIVLKSRVHWQANTDYGFLSGSGCTHARFP